MLAFQLAIARERSRGNSSAPGRPNLARWEPSGLTFTSTGRFARVNASRAALRVKAFQSRPSFVVSQVEMDQKLLIPATVLS